MRELISQTFYVSPPNSPINIAMSERDCYISSISPMSISEELRLPVPCSTGYSEIFKRCPVWRSEEPPEDCLGVLHSLFQPPTSRHLWPKTIRDIGNDRINLYLRFAGTDAVGSKSKIN